MISHDAGETWVSKSKDKDCKMLFDVKMFDKKTGFVCATTDEDISKSNASILKTTDGGISWKKDINQQDLLKLHGKFHFLLKRLDTSIFNPIIQTQM
jgi:photosystem II stability/assembly factor-like uncharacterized protein